MAEGAGGTRRRTWAFVVVGLVVAAFVGAGVAIVAVGSGDDDVSDAVTLVPAEDDGDDAFAPSTAVGQVVSFPAEARATAGGVRDDLPPDDKTGGLSAVGTTPGLYGGSGDTKVCDPNALVAFLEGHQDKAAAWADVFGIQSAGIPKFVATLVPLVLTTDTLVTNYGYRDGIATPRQSVLQAGTAVLVDQTGTPRVKCNCGNPLARPVPLTLARASTQGAPWPGYRPATVALVRPGPPTTSLTVIDLQTGRLGPVPVGGAAWVAASVSGPTARETTIATSSDGKDWRPVARLPNEVVHALTYAQGKWVAMASPPGSNSTDVLESVDLTTWHRSGSVPDVLGGVAFGDDRWVATGLHSNPGAVSTALAHASPVVYTSDDARTWTKSSGGIQGKFGSIPVAFGRSQWLSAAEADTRPGGGATVVATTVFLSHDGQQWSETGGRIDGLSGAHAAFGAGRWVLGGAPYGAGVAVATSADARSWSPATRNGLENTSIDAIAYGGGQFLASGEVPGPDRGSFGAIMLSSPDGTTWTRIGTLPGPVFALSRGIIPTIATTVTTSTSTTSTTLAPSPSPSPSTTTAAAPASGPCTTAAVQAALDAGSVAATVRCQDGWAAVGATDSDGNDYVALVRWSGQAWQEVDRATSCGDGSVPQPLYQAACTTS